MKKIVMESLCLLCSVIVGIAASISKNWFGNQDLAEVLFGSSVAFGFMFVALAFIKEEK